MYRYRCGVSTASRRRAQVAGPTTALYGHLAIAKPWERQAARRGGRARPRPSLEPPLRGVLGIEEPRRLSQDLLDSRDRAHDCGEQLIGRYCQEEQDAELRDHRSRDVPECQCKTDQDCQMNDLDLNDVDGERVRRQKPPDRSSVRRESSEYHQHCHAEPGTERGRENSRRAADTRGSGDIIPSASTASVSADRTAVTAATEVRARFGH